MDIAGFYDSNPRRRDSEEVSFGDGWTRHDDAHATYRMSWVVDTGELYVVREPHHGGMLASYLDQFRLEQPDLDELTVDVLTVVQTREAAESLLSGWEKAQEQTDSLGWVRRKIESRSGS